MAPVRVAILSDDRLFCDGLERILASDSFTIVARDEEAVWGPAMQSARADVLLLGGNMNGALDFCAALRRAGGPAVLFTGARDDDAWARVALEAGARGILSTRARAEDLIKAVRVVHEGRIWAPRHVIEACMIGLTGSTAATRAGEVALEQLLSPREREIFRQAAMGRSNKELALRFAISAATVKAHLTRIFQKLGLRGRAELAAAYHGVVPFGLEQGTRGRVATSASSESTLRIQSADRRTTKS